MPIEPNLEGYLSVVIKEGLYPNKGNLRFHLKTLFRDITIENRRVLDIGGGSGLHSFYAACMGATRGCVSRTGDGREPFWDGGKV